MDGVSKLDRINFESKEEADAWSKIAIENGYNSQKIKDDASIHLTPAMRYDAGKIINNLRKEIRYD